MMKKIAKNKRIKVHFNLSPKWLINSVKPFALYKMTDKFSIQQNQNENHYDNVIGI